MTVHVLGICGSRREASYNRMLLHEAMRRAPAGLLIHEFDIRPLPFYDGDLEAEAYPAVVREVKDAVRSSDCVLFATPEYDYTLPGGLKNAVEWLSRPTDDNALSGKPLALMGASTGYMGTLRCQLAWRQMWYYFKAPVFSGVELTVARAADAFDADGRLTVELYVQTLDRLLLALRDWLEAIRAEP